MVFTPYKSPPVYIGRGAPNLIDVAVQLPAAIGQQVEGLANAASGSNDTATLGAGSYVSNSAVEQGAGGIPGAAAVENMATGTAHVAGAVGKGFIAAAENLPSELFVLAIIALVVAGVVVYAWGKS